MTSQKKLAREKILKIAKINTSDTIQLKNFKISRGIFFESDTPLPARCDMNIHIYIHFSLHLVQHALFTLNPSPKNLSFF